MSNGDDIQIAEHPRGKEKLVVKLRKYQGRWFCDVRLHYQHSQTKAWLPGQKGIALRPSEVVAISSALDRAMDLIANHDSDMRDDR